eukprot:jgi/Bigna1/85417/estExt_fgenesh1_pg.C_40044
MAACDDVVGHGNHLCPPGTVIKLHSTRDIIVGISGASTDHREYKSFTLDNGLEVIAIRDKTSARSSVSLDINVGSFYDPNEIPGVAHFLEHMLFLGSKKFPKEGNFDAVLAENGGYSNAYTATENTNYYFTVSNKAFNKTTEMFANMFIDPLLSMDATNREANAINAEHEKNHQNDGWRFEQVKRDIATPGHPFNRFGTGNAKTLLKDVKKSHAALVQLFKGHYCTPNMHMTLLSSQPLEVTTDLAISYFTGIRSKCEGSDSEYGIGEAMKLVSDGGYHPAYDSSALGSKVYVRSLAKQQSLTLLWQIPPQGNKWNEKSGQYLGNVLSGQHKGSLYELLVRDPDGALIKGGIDAGAADDFSMFGTFEVQLSLTRRGSTKVPYILRAVHHYLSMIEKKKEGITEERYEEYKVDARHEFDFKEKESPEDYTSSVAASMRLYPASQVLFATSNYAKFSPASIRSIMAAMKPENLIVFYSGKHHDKKLSRSDKYYNVEYDVAKFEPKLLEELKTARGEGSDAEDSAFSMLALPPKSEFVVTDTSVKEIDAKTPRFAKGADPEALVIRNDYVQKPSDSQRCVAHWLQDSYFKQPKISVSLSYSKSAPFVSAKEQVSASLFASMAQDALRIETDDASRAGYDFSIGASNTGFQVKVSGFSQHFKKFLTLVLERLRDPSKLLKKRRFESIKVSLANSVENSLLEEPYKRIGSFMSAALERPHLSTWDLMAGLKEVTFADCEAIHAKLFSDAAVEVFVFGDANLKDAQDITALVTDRLPVKASSPELLAALPSAEYVRVAKPQPSKISTFRAPLTDKSNPNSCVQTYWQYGRKRSEKDPLYLSVLSSIAHGPAYDTLRTKEQLGYIVSSGADRRSHVLGFKVLVESATKPAKHLHRRIMNFMKKLDAIVENLSSEHFKTVVLTLSNGLMEPPQRASKSRDSVLAEIQSREYQYNRRAKNFKVLHTLELSEFKQFYENMRSGAVVSVQLDPQAEELSSNTDENANPVMGMDGNAERLMEYGTTFEMVGKLSQWRADQEEFDLKKGKDIPACKFC